MAIAAKTARLLPVVPICNTSAWAHGSPAAGGQFQHWAPLLRMIPQGVRLVSVRSFLAEQILALPLPLTTTAMAINLQQISARLTFYMRIKELDKYQLSVLTQTQPALVGCILQGEEYSMDELLAFLKQLPDLNSRWVIYGEGNVFKSEDQPNASSLDPMLKKDRSAYLAEMQTLLQQLEEVEKQKQEQNHLDQLRHKIRDLTRHI